MEKGIVEKVMGPMFSGKTHEAMFQCLRHLAIGEKVAYVTHAEDRRYDEGDSDVRTHGGHTLSAAITPTKLRQLSRSPNADTRAEKEPEGIACVKDERLTVFRVNTLAQVVDKVGGMSFVVVDEAQFFTDLQESVRQMAAAGKNLVVCGLDLTAECVPFGAVLSLPADKVKTLQAMCSECHAPAAFTRRIAGEASTMDVGGTDKYMAVCRKHHPCL